MDWLTRRPLPPGGPPGKVVLVDFWTFTCINWLRTQPYIRAWADKYRTQVWSLFGSTHRSSVSSTTGQRRRAARDMNIAYPIAIDNDYAIWDDFDNQYWPALYLIDARGRIRHHHSAKAATTGERPFSHCWPTPAPRPSTATSLVEGRRNSRLPPTGATLQIAGDLRRLRSRRAASRRRAARRGSSTSTRFRRGCASTSGRSPATGRSAAGDIALEKAAAASRFAFTDATCISVMGPRDRPSARFRVSLDGRAAGRLHGLDVDEQGNGAATDSGSTSSFDSEGRSPIGRSRSSSSIGASKRSPSRSADVHGCRLRRQRERFLLDPSPGDALHADLTAVRFDDSASDRKAEPDAAVRSLLISLPKTIEYMRQLLGRDACAGVDHGDFDQVAAIRRAQLDASARRCEQQRALPPR